MGPLKCILAFISFFLSSPRGVRTPAEAQPCDAPGDHGSVKRMVVRLNSVQGLEGRFNDVLFAPARAHTTPRALVYWGGDVQDYPEVMQAHRDNRVYLKWNLENTARMLSHDFPTHHVVVVRPSRIEYKSFSCYDNFVPSNNAGVPAHTPTHGALLHLQRLLQEVGVRLKNISEEELLACPDVSLPENIDIEDLHRHCPPKSSPKEGNSNGANADPVPESSHEPPDTDRLWWRPRLALDTSSLTLVGFSKGCVVLNQLCYEFHHTRTLTPEDSHSQATKFISRIEAMYWLDGGHAGGRDTWVTARPLLETLASLNVDLYVHVSPYQVRDEARPWIGREERVFTGTLKKLGANIHRYLHEAGGAGVSLQLHFSVVGRFGRLQAADTE